MPLKIVKFNDTRHGPNWYIRGSVSIRLPDGTRRSSGPKFESTETTDRVAADGLCARRTIVLLDELAHGKRVGHSFAEAALSYMERPGASIRERRFALALFDAWRDLPLAGINQETIDRRIRDRYAAAKPSTILRALVKPATAILHHAAARGWCAEPKFQRPKEPRGRKRWLPYEVAERLIAACHGSVKHLRPLIVALLYTGARIGELLDLEWADVDLSARWAVLRGTKNGQDRGIALHQRVVIELANLPHREGHVFLSRSGRRWRDTKRARGGQIETAWRTLLARAGIEDFTPHGCRHTCSTWLTMAGTQEQIRDEQLGHASTSIGRGYSHVPRSTLIAAVDRLEWPVICENAVSAPPSAAGATR